MIDDPCRIHACTHPLSYHDDQYIFKCRFLTLHNVDLVLTGGIDIAAMKEDMGEQDKADKWDEKQKRREAKRVQSKIVVFVVMNLWDANKKDYAARINSRCLCLFLFYCFFFKAHSKSTFLCQIWSKICPQKRLKNIMSFCLFLFLPDLVNKMSSNREQKRSCRRENR